MKDGAVQLALREWRTLVTRPVPLVAFAAVACILGVAGPFDTDVAMRMIPRTAYWFFVVVASYSWGFLVDTSLRNWRGGPMTWPWVGLSGLCTGLGVLFVVSTTNALALGFWPELHAWPEFAGTILVISMIVTVALNYISAQSAKAAPEANTLPPILDRLPFDKRAALVALSVEDHYVRIQTTKGEELVLLRLSDAIREIGSTRGAQVHRSHWAAFDQVKSVRRDGDRAILTMATGADIPVSRANLPKIKEAGLLPA